MRFYYTIAAFFQEGALRLDIDDDKRLTNAEIKEEVNNAMVRMGHKSAPFDMIYSERKEGTVNIKVFTEENSKLREITSPREILKLASKIKKAGK